MLQKVLHNVIQLHIRYDFLVKFSGQEQLNKQLVNIIIYNIIYKLFNNPMGYRCNIKMD